MAHGVEWARQLKDQLEGEIRILRARAREGVHSTEALGFLPDQDHIEDLLRRLAQVDRLIEAAPETEPASEFRWPTDLGERPGVPSR